MSLACPCCQTSTWLAHHQVGSYSYLRCAHCQSSRLDPVPDLVSTSTIFDTTYFEGGKSGGYLDYDGEQAARTANAKHTLQRLHHRNPSAERLIEIGSASGWLLSEAITRGWTVTGVELSDAMRDRSAQRLPPGTPLLRSLDHLDPSDSFDVAVLVQVLEHIPDPGSTLDELANRLTPGGTLLIETWNARSRVARLFGKRWQQVTPPSVIWLFSADGLREALERRGLTDVRITATSKRVGLGSVLSLVAAKSPVAQDRLHRLASSGRVKDKTLPYKLGDLITVTANKPS